MAFLPKTPRACLKKICIPVHSYALSGWNSWLKNAFSTRKSRHCKQLPSSVRHFFDCTIAGNYRDIYWKKMQCRLIVSDHSHNFHSCGNIRFACASGLPPGKSSEYAEKQIKEKK